MPRRFPCLALVMGALACEAPPVPEARGQPADFLAEVPLAAPVDLDPDPRTLEIALDARLERFSLIPAGDTELMSYGGSLPGPLIRARAGDRLLVHFTNRLPLPTTVHWHGVRVPANMDGTPVHSQPEIPPGGTFDYDFVLTDPGLFWYHPHVQSARTTGSGLYGALLVEDPRGEPGGADEVVLVLSDVGLDERGALLPPDNGGDLATLFGREGTHLLVNGRHRPSLHVRAGRRQRWRLVNAAKSRYFQLELPGHSFTRIGGDGGLIQRPVESSRLLLIPGERADVWVVPRGAPGSRLPLTWVPYDRGYGSVEFRQPETVLELAFAEGAEEPEPAPALRPEVAPLEPTGATPVELELTKSSTTTQLILGINGVPAWSAVPVPARVGETQLFTVKNAIDWAHPFHLHGFFFQVLGEDLRPREPIEWKDTVDVGVKGTTRLLVRYDGRPGMWMFHCHILDHADAGMMGMVRLEGGEH